MWQKVKKKFLALGRATKFLNLGCVMGRGRKKFSTWGGARGGQEKKLAGAGRIGFSPRPTALAKTNHFDKKNSFE